MVEPISPAYERVKQMLFKPFNPAKWIIIGFCAWLAGLGESGGGGSFHSGGNSGNHASQPVEQFRHFYHEAGDYVALNLGWIIPAAVLLVLVVVGLWLLVLWLSSRGKFMFLHCVALDKAEVAVPWAKFAGAGNSLFRFRIVLGLIGMVLTLPLLVFAGLSVLRMVLQGEADVAGVMVAAGLGLAFVLLSLVIAAITPQVHGGFCGAHHVSAGRKLPGGVAGILRAAFSQPREVCAVCLVSDRPRLGHQHHRPAGGSGDVLHRRLLPDVAAVHRHGAAGAGVQAGVSIILSGAI